MVILGLLPAGLSAQDSDYDENKVPSYTLPEVLVSLKGQEISASREWMEIRRPEILSLLLRGILHTGMLCNQGEKKILFSESFDDDRLDERGWYDGTATRIIKDSRRGEGCIEYEWTRGVYPVQGSSQKRRLFEPTEEVYIRFYIRLSEGWQWGSAGRPHLLHFLTSENSEYHGPASSHLTLYIEPVYGKLRLAASDMMNQRMPHGTTQGPLRGGYNGRLYDSENVLFTEGKWHCVEAQFRLNSLDKENDVPNNDGIVRGWFDGQLVIEHTDVILRSPDFPGMKFNQFLMAPFFGPGNLDNNQKVWIDELVVSTERVGPLLPLIKK